jgi:hypothetical protein
LRAGSLAYIDSPFTALLPCKVVRVWRANDYPTMRAEVIVTASRGAYKKGERLPDVWAKYGPPRDAIRRRDGQFRVLPFTCIEG